ncbi:unnamed protein product [Closterium sp. NIES-54]
MLDSFGLSEANPVRTPLPTGFDVHAHAEEPLLRDELVQLYQSIVGSLMYASTTTQPQIAYAVSQLSKVVSCPKAFHLQAAKRVLRYLKGCVKSGIFYPTHSKPQVELVGFSDADYAGDSADRKSHTGYVYCLNGAAISWQSKRQPVVALSTTETEYISLCQCIQEGVWLKRLFGEFGHDLAGGVPVFVDNQPAIALAQNACLHGRTKHMQVRWHFIREMVASGEVILRWCPTNRQAADILTKPLPFERHGVCMSLMGMQPHVGMVPEQDVGGLAPREWHDTLRTTLTALGFAPSTADPSLFLRIDTTLLPLYVLVYVDDLVFATADMEALALVKAELQKRHTCTDLGELRSYLGLEITRDRARRTITLTHASGMGLVLGGQGSVVHTGHSDASWADDQELRWLTYLLTDLGERPRSSPFLYVDNKAMLALCHEQRLEHRTKHIAFRYFLARELQHRRQLRLSYVASRANTADVFTKALGSGDHQRFCTALGLVPTLPHLLVS